MQYNVLSCLISTYCQVKLYVNKSRVSTTVYLNSQQILHVIDSHVKYNLYDFDIPFWMYYLYFILIYCQVVIQHDNVFHKYASPHFHTCISAYYIQSSYQYTHPLIAFMSYNIFLTVCVLLVHID